MTGSSRPLDRADTGVPWRCAPPDSDHRRARHAGQSHSGRSHLRHGRGRHGRARQAVRLASPPRTRARGVLPAEPGLGRSLERRRGISRAFHLHQRQRRLRIAHVDGAKQRPDASRGVRPHLPADGAFDPDGHGEPDGARRGAADGAPVPRHGVARAQAPAGRRARARALRQRLARADDASDDRLGRARAARPRRRRADRRGVPGDPGRRAGGVAPRPGSGRWPAHALAPGHELQRPAEHDPGRLSARCRRTALEPGDGSPARDRRACRRRALLRPPGHRPAARQPDRECAAPHSRTARR